MNSNSAPLSSSESTMGARLCRACGLCCNGVLFTEVQLMPGDRAQRLSDLGLRIRRRETRSTFRQPCPCLKDRQCTIYDDRPERCRRFRCRPLMAAGSHQITEDAALAIIQQARRRLAEMESLFTELGERSLCRSLANRFANTQAASVEWASGTAKGAAWEALKCRMTAFRDFTGREFLPAETSNSDDMTTA